MCSPSSVSQGAMILITSVSFATTSANPPVAITFISDPKPTIEAIAAKAVSNALRDQVAPVMGQMIEQNHNSVVAEQKGEVDRVFGAGTWDREFAPELDPIFEGARKDNPSSLGSKTAITKAEAFKMSKTQLCAIDDKACRAELKRRADKKKKKR